ncbi:pyridoxal phosphate-dependent transferase [Gongronella butleri]|nr:pyridoxal phosphate-dependent transferase [Gongronella butleri]
MTPSFGKVLRKEFFLKDGYVPLNHGSYGTYPKILRDRHHHYQAQAEENPDRFYRREMFPLLDANRAALGKLMHCDANDLVFVTNATSGVNSTVRSLMTTPGDQLICFSTAYNAVASTLDYVRDTYKINVITVQLDYPLSDDDVLSKLSAAIQEADGPIKLCVMDAITSVPGVRFPYERACALLREYGILSLVDAAHAVGQIPIDLSASDPDFFVTNCHKWLYTPRGCAVLYVRKQIQYMIHPALINASYKHHNGPNENVSSFQDEYNWPGTCDFSSFLCVGDSLAFIESLGGLDAIQAYCHRLAVEGGQLVAEILGTEVLENEEKSLTMNMANVRLPIAKSHPRFSDVKLTDVLIDKMLYDEDCMGSPYFHNGQWFVRLSAQVYTDLDDFKAIGHALKRVCESL